MTLKELLQSKCHQFRRLSATEVVRLIQTAYLAGRRSQSEEFRTKAAKRLKERVAYRNRLIESRAVDAVIGTKNETPDSKALLATKVGE